jgi:hypothetical protein
MTITLTPITSFSNVTRTAVPPEADVYKDIHKGIRAELFGLTLQAGTTDPSAQCDAVALADRVDAMAALLVAHAEHEDGFVQPYIQQFAPEAAASVAADHPALEDRLVELRAMAQVAVEASTDDRRAALHELYLELASFTSAYLAHQDLEERVVSPALAAAMPAEEIQAIDRAIVASIPPAEMGDALSIMLPAMNIDDRTTLLGGAKAGMPVEMFAGVWALVRSVLGDTAAAQVGNRIGVDAG